jgi:hypothetical protein
MLILAVVPIQPATQLVLGAVSSGVKHSLKLTTDLHLILRLRMVKLNLHSPIYLHDVVLN